MSMLISPEKSDRQLQSDVLKEMNWDCSVTADALTVTADRGIITLRGSVPHYIQKKRAQDAAERVKGTRAVVNEIEVSVMASHERSDQDIARAAVNSLEWNCSAPNGIQVEVESGCVTLRGEVEWDFQRQVAEDAVSPLKGLSGVENLITIRRRELSTDVKSRIEEALKRSAENESHKIVVSAEGDRVTLSGQVATFAELRDARIAAWSAPGVGFVQNDLTIAA